MWWKNYSHIYCTTLKCKINVSNFYKVSMSSTKLVRHSIFGEIIKQMRCWKKLSAWLYKATTYSVQEQQFETACILANDGTNTLA
jgi:hypothetical protein